MKRVVLFVIGIFLLALSGAGPALGQQPSQTPQEPPQEQPAQAQPAVQMNLTVEEAVMCTGVTDRTPQGVPSLTAPATATETATPAAAAAPQAATAAAPASTAAGSEGGEAPFPFAAGVGKLYCFTKVSGATTAATIKHVWYFGDTVVHTMELSLDGSPWRTWSNKTIPAEWTGTGKVEVQDASGNILKTLNFIVQ
jgi:hypothetical protein